MKETKEVKDLKLLSQYLDSKFNGPFGIRFGLDSLLGLIPGLGDSITAVLSLYIIVRGASLGASGAVVLRMTFNSLIDYVFGLVPILGDAFDLYWKANDRNYELIKRHINSPEKTKAQSIFYLALAFLIGVFILLMPLALLYFVISMML